jgi:hypothetical protein
MTSDHQCDLVTVSGQQHGERRAAQSAIDAGQLLPETDPDQLAFEIESVLLSANWYFHLFDDPSYMTRAGDAVRMRLARDATELAGQSSP